MVRFDVSKVLRVSSSLLNIPYKPNCSTYEGADCVGLVLLFYKEYGIDIPYDNQHGYEERRYLASDVDTLLFGCKKFFHIHSKESTLIYPGDLLIFQHDRRLVSTHLGVAVTGFEFLHMDRVKKSSTIDKLRLPILEFGLESSNKWASKLKYVGKLRKTKWVR